MGDDSQKYVDFRFYCADPSEIKNFDEIQDIDHQAYFINIIKWPLYAIGEEYFEDWVKFILKYIQHPSGKIRQAVLHFSDYLITNIVISLRFSEDRKISKADRQKVEKNKERFGHFIYTVEYLLGRYDEPKFSRYKYINSMPASVYKSLQKLMVEHLLRNEYYEKLYADFLKNLSQALDSSQFLTEHDL